MLVRDVTFYGFSQGEGFRLLLALGRAGALAFGNLMDDRLRQLARLIDTHGRVGVLADFHPLGSAIDPLEDVEGLDPVRSDANLQTVHLGIVIGTALS